MAYLILLKFQNENGLLDNHLMWVNVKCVVILKVLQQ